MEKISKKFFFFAINPKIFLGITALLIYDERKRGEGKERKRLIVNGGDEYDQKSSFKVFSKEVRALK